MTALVNVETGEFLDAAAAERRAERITLRLDAIADNYRMVLPMIREAIAKRDDLALGYRSPGDYVRDRFGQSLAGLGVDVRRAVVGELTAAGLSTRAIAPVVGVTQQMVSKDRAAIAGDNPVVTSQTPAASVAGPAPASAGAHPKAAPDEAVGAAAARVDTKDSTAATPEGEMPATPRPPVVGIDGKTYPAAAATRARPEPQAATAAPATRRRPLPESFWTAAYDLGKKAESLHRLVQDDRWTQNAKKVAAANRSDLLRINDLLQQVIDALPTEESTHD